MRTIFSTLILLIISVTLSAQTTVILPINTLTFSTDTVYHFSPGGGPFNLHVCSDAHVTVTGFSTYMGKFFLEENASLSLHDTINFYVVADVYMKKNATYDFNHKAGSINDTIIAESPVNLIDTGTAVFTFLPVTTLTFDYSQLTGGVSPCLVPSLNSEISLSNQAIQIGNPFQDKLVIYLKDADGPMIFSLTDSKGKRVLFETIHQGNHEFMLPSLSQGIYFYELIANGKVIQRGKLLHE